MIVYMGLYAAVNRPYPLLRNDQTKIGLQAAPRGPSTRGMIMSGHEAQLLARAEELDETSGLAGQAIAILGHGRAAGLDTHNALAGLIRAALTLDGDHLAIYQAHGTPFADERNLADALLDAEDEIMEWLAEARRTQTQAMAALAAARAALAAAGAALAAAQAALAAAGDALADAQAALTAAQAIPADTEEGSSARDAAIAAAQESISEAEGRIAEAQQRIALAEQALAILGPLTGRLRRALAHLRRVPQDLGEYYEGWYEHLRRGRQAPYDGRWITGEGADLVGAGQANGARCGCGYPACRSGELPSAIRTRPA